MVLKTLSLLVATILCSWAVLGADETNGLPNYLNFTVILRDFSSFHADFESPASSIYEETGILESQLGPAELPLFTPYGIRTRNTPKWDGSCSCWKNDSTLRLSNYGQFYWDEYYRDIPGVNIPVTKKLEFTLKDESSQTYVFPPNGDASLFGNPYVFKFFPLDGFGFDVESQRDLHNQTHNYWFTTEIRTQFFYRGGERFDFIGDDDLWVFIDGKLTSCDLGGLHSQRKCSVILDNVPGLALNKAHDMVVFHAERHTNESNFMVTTSILPINRRPRAITPQNPKTLYENAQYYDLKLSVLVTDPDGDATTIQFKRLPKDGVVWIDRQEIVQLDQWYSSSATFELTPTANFWGNDYLLFVASDGQLESIDTANVTWTVVAQNVPPKATNQTITIELKNGPYSGKLTYSDPDIKDAFEFVLPSELRLLGDLVVSRNGSFTYTPKIGGTDIIPFCVNATDLKERHESWAVLTIIVNDGNDSAARAPLSDPIVIASVALGAILGFAALAGTIGYFLYFRYGSKRDEEKWKEECERELADLMNPMYEGNQQVITNMLYNKSIPITSMQGQDNNPDYMAQTRTAQFAPQTKAFTPQTAQFAPQSAQYTPATSQYGAESGQYGPQSGQYSQSTPYSVGPEAAQYTPMSNQYNPPTGQYGQGQTYGY